MLQSIRDRAQGWLAWLIVGLISVPFALWGINEYLNPSATLAVAEVNGVEVNEYEYRSQVQQQIQRFSQSLGANFDVSRFQSTIRESTLESMIDEEVLVQTATDNDMRVGDALLATQIQGLAAFQEDGKFSKVLYERNLSYQGMTPALFEHRIRRALVAEQLRNGVVLSEVLTGTEKQSQQQAQEQRRLISYLQIPVEKFLEKIEISDSEIEEYFSDNKRNFYTDEKLSVEYVQLSKSDLAKQQDISEDLLKQRYEKQRERFTTEPSWQARHILIKKEGDGAAGLEKARDLIKQLEAGADFAELAKSHSTDTGSAPSGGDLGEFGKGVMVKPFEEAIRAMKEGEISKEPVESRFGYHIIKLEKNIPEKVKTFDEVRAELLKEMQLEQAESAFYNLTDQFANLAFEQPDNLDVLAETLGLKKETTPLFGKYDKPNEPAFLLNPKVEQAAFSDAVLKQGQNSEVLEIDDQHFLVLRLKEHKPAQEQPLEAVKEEIIKALKQSKAREKAEEFAQTLLKDKDTSPRQSPKLQELGLEWTKLQWIKRNDPNLEYDKAGTKAFKMGQPEENQVIYHGWTELNGSYVLLAVFSVHNPEAGETLPASYDSELGQTAFTLMSAAFRNQAEVKIFRENLGLEQ